MWFLLCLFNLVFVLYCLCYITSVSKVYYIYLMFVLFIIFYFFYVCFILCLFYITFVDIKTFILTWFTLWFCVPSIGELVSSPTIGHGLHVYNKQIWLPEHILPCLDTHIDEIRRCENSVIDCITWCVGGCECFCHSQCRHCPE